MDVYIAAIRPKRGSSLGDVSATSPNLVPSPFNAAAYEILLVSRLSSTSASRASSRMPHVERSLPYLQAPTEAPLAQLCLEFVRGLTSTNSASGVRGSRALVIASGNSNHLVPFFSKSAFSQGTVASMRTRGFISKQNTQILVCVTASESDGVEASNPRLSPLLSFDEPLEPRFFPLDFVISAQFHAHPAFSAVSKHHLHELEKWLAKVHSNSAGASALFQAPAASRITGAAYSPSLIASDGTRDSDILSPVENQLAKAPNGEVSTKEVSPPPSSLSPAAVPPKRPAPPPPPPPQFLTQPLRRFATNVVAPLLPEGNYKKITLIKFNHLSEEASFAENLSDKNKKPAENAASAAATANRSASQSPRDSSSSLSLMEQISQQLGTSFWDSQVGGGVAGGDSPPKRSSTAHHEWHEVDRRHLDGAAKEEPSLPSAVAATRLTDRFSRKLVYRKAADSRGNDGDDSQADALPLSPDHRRGDSGDSSGSVGKSSLSSIQRWLNSPASVSALECQKHRDRVELKDRILAALEALDKCDAVVVNPLFSTGLTFRPRVVAVVNPYWNMGQTPDYSKVRVPRKWWARSASQRRVIREADFPLHRAAYHGSSKDILDLILNQQKSPTEFDDDHWTPLHHAAWGGNADAVRSLLYPVASKRVADGDGADRSRSRDSASMPDYRIARRRLSDSAPDFLASPKEQLYQLPRHPHSLRRLPSDVKARPALWEAEGDNVDSTRGSRSRRHRLLRFPTFQGRLGFVGADPNARNAAAATPLHLAALCGHAAVVEELVDHPKIDLEAKNKEGKTAYDLCKSHPMPEYQACAQKIQESMNRPKQSVAVHLMDGRKKDVVLKSGFETTVEEINSEMVKLLLLDTVDASPASGKHPPDQEPPRQVFSVWICSKSLCIPLLPEACPMYLMELWTTAILPQLTNIESEMVDSEPPRLFYKRDAWLTLSAEQKVRNPIAISLLFYEAYHNFIDGLFPCTEDDGVSLAALFLASCAPKRDFAKHLQSLVRAEENNLYLVVPKNLVVSRGGSSSSSSSNVAATFAKNVAAAYQKFKDNMPSPQPPLWVLQHHYLKFCWNLTVYGSRYFYGDRLTGSGGVGRRQKSKTPIVVAVNDVGVHVLGVPVGAKGVVRPQEYLQTFPFERIQLQYDFDRCRLNLRCLDGTKKLKGPVVAIHSKQVQLIVDQYKLMSGNHQQHKPELSKAPSKKVKTKL